MYYELIKTPIGWIGICGDEDGLCRLQLPEKNKKETERKILEKIKEKTLNRPKWFSILVEKINHLFLSENVDFSDIPINIKVGPFQNKVYNELRKVPAGKVVTYKKLAEMIQSPKAARAVGMAMRKNPIPLVIPCHRVISSSKGSLGGFSAYRGEILKNELLKYEKIDNL